MSFNNTMPPTKPVQAPVASLLEDVKVVFNADQQFRLVRFQLHNWGTFSDYHDIPISEEGFLITGPSGSGKTTLLDAYSTMLIPGKWLEYNSAARDSGRRDRNLISYVRGAWAAIRSGGNSDITTQFLRPNATWSSLALTFKKGLRDYVTLIQLFWVKGTEMTKISRHYFIAKREFSLEELDFAGKNFDLKELKNSLSFDLECRTFEDYHAFYGEILGLAEDNALKLLQKTQSMKNIEDLDSFLRNFMLDEPDTYESAKQMVEEFTALNAAHEAVQKAKWQMETLGPIRPNWNDYNRAGAELFETLALSEALETYANQRRRELIQAELDVLRAKEQDLIRQFTTYAELIGRQTDKLKDLRAQYSANDGDILEQFINNRNDRLRRQELVKANLGKVKIALKHLGFGDADSKAGFEEAQRMAKREFDALEDSRKSIRLEFKSLVAREAEISAEQKRTKREIDALNEQEGTIPAEDWELKKLLLEKLNRQSHAKLTPKDLPFLGHLVSVKPEQARWEAAIERAMAPLATTVLVPEELYERVSDLANAGPIGGRLSYLKVSKLAMDFSAPKSAATDTLLSKLDFSPGPYGHFLALELGRRLNLLCVEYLEDFRKNFSALTPEGQVKLDNERHEKDDRRPFGDVRAFRLGSDRSRKLKAFSGDLAKQSSELNDIQAKISDNDAMERDLEKRGENCRTIEGLTWEEIDLATLNAEITDLDEKIKLSQSKNLKLGEIRKAIIKAELEREELIKNRAICEQKLTDNQETASELSSDLHEIMFKEVSPALTEANRDKLFKRFIGYGTLTLRNVNEITLKVGRELDNSKNEWQDKQTSAEHKLKASFEAFVSRWPEDSLDLEPRLPYAGEFIKKLESLELDGLPKLREHFSNLLHKHSEQNAAVLLSWLNQNLKTIFRRLAVVNDSLASLPFNQSAGKPTFLNLRLIDRHLPEVTEFKEALKSVTTDLYNQDPFLNEERFKTLKRLVTDLSSPDRDKASWRELVLDVRRHVEFTGREIDQSGEEIESYRSGAGKSGGQRQKLAAACLAAALRYQLGGKNYGFPRFGTVVFDEAFDKIDNELTVIALEIFKKLGFQMILATPMKNIPASEPYIGGAVYVAIADRKNSSVTAVVYDRERKKLVWPDDRPPEADA
ncbi:MAG: hypothetical protein LBJ61_10510 [Deltaproteobacteria bacterium]|jgi:uncharacterized protein YPO0396|nr:hypothetical protein [Deltaproteobacteria bacterium]